MSIQLGQSLQGGVGIRAEMKLEARSQRCVAGLPQRSLVGPETPLSPAPPFGSLSPCPQSSPTSAPKHVSMPCHSPRRGPVDALLFHAVGNPVLSTSRASSES